MINKSLIHSNNQSHLIGVENKAALFLEISKILQIQSYLNLKTLCILKLLKMPLLSLKKKLFTSKEK